MSKFVAVVGNPNVGKTTLFNSLTGLALVTANYPGVTVERKVGRMQLEGEPVYLIDLPGTYSLSARSPDEMIVADVLLSQQKGEEPVDLILAVVDASNLERNLYLVTQLLELGKPLLIALNMCDLAERHGVAIDYAQLEQVLGAPVVPVCAHKRVGIDALRASLQNLLQGQTAAPKPLVTFSEQFCESVRDLHAELNQKQAVIGRRVSLFEALRVLADRGGYAEQRLVDALGEPFRDKLNDYRLRAAQDGAVAAEESITRFKTIRRILDRCVRVSPKRQDMFSERLDSFLTHPILGLVFFVLVMSIMFQSIYNAAAPVVAWIDAGLSLLVQGIDNVLPQGVLRSLLVDGCIAGVGSVLAFLPQIVVLTLFIALLEDCGYMARAAFLMDKFLFRCGLSGHSFIPLLSSFACAIPGIMATRTISDRRDRFVTILVAPLISCSARLPVYSVMIAAFVPNTPVLGGFVRLQGLTLLLMYALGILLAAPMAWLFKKTILPGAPPPFLLELPSYKLPQMRTVVFKVYRQGKEFLKRAGTLIFALTVVTWALAYFPPLSSNVEAVYENQRREIEQTFPDGDEREVRLAQLERDESRARLENSFLGRAGRSLAFLFKPLGWDWRIGVATLSSFPAREVVVATLGIIFNIENPEDESNEGLVSALRQAKRPDGSPLFTVSVALSLMVFFALCCQCGGTLIIIQRETNSWRWPAFTFAYMTALAYIGAFVVFRIGNWFENMAPH
ncbi:MAG TPA: ferrous iron transport protein B [Candidatus Hydrogenedentes bacterium]|nr:ferrous iron transport protein B [Candidatus Hydrogenedentota bacterium]HOL76175.1 ferrous iron transport protein B [Candidatus Hydrogenedentota bacterium]HPO84790.1 ferrous iron transport protein B [Candidatus Hydrogenedentota bacterium]